MNNELAKEVKYDNDVVSSSLEDYYTKAEIDDNYVLKSDLPSDDALAHYVDSSDYYTKSQVDNNLNTAISAIKP